MAGPVEFGTMISDKFSSLPVGTFEDDSSVQSHSKYGELDIYNSFIEQF